MYSGVKEPCPSLHHFMLYVAHGPYMAWACSMLRVCRFLRAFASLIFAQSSACWMGARILPGCHSKKDCSSKGAPGSSWPTCCARVEGADPPVGKKVNTSSKSSPRIPWAKERFGLGPKRGLASDKPTSTANVWKDKTSGDPWASSNAIRHIHWQGKLGTCTGKEG